jgi:YHS domain-containing protein
MRRLSLVVAMIAAIAASYSIGRRHPYSQTARKTAGLAVYYVDPMHPAYRSDRPGIAPDCGMPLEPVYADSGAPAQLPAGAVGIDSATQRLLGIRVVPAEKGGAGGALRIVGRVTPEDALVYRINAGVDGFIRETYQDSVGVRVAKDQRLAIYYAPEFLPAASGFLAANERVPGAAAKEGTRSVQNYMDRLRNLGMSDVQLKRVAETRQLPESIDVVAPAEGFILARNISPGQHFERGMEFYRLADLRRVWVAAEIGEQEAPWLRPGAPAQISLRAEGRRFPARVSDSLPQTEAGGGTVKLRLEVDNPAFVLRPEMLVDVELPVRMPPAITVPTDAVVDSGARARVYVERGEGVFEPRQVETGWRFGERVEIVKGVQPGERVVAAATFLVDSESRLKTPSNGAGERPTAAARTVRDPSCGMPVDPARAAASGNTLAWRGATYYFCSRQCKQAFQSDPAGVAGRRPGDAGD